MEKTCPHISKCRVFRGQDSEGWRQTWRPPGATAEQVRTGGELEDCESTRHSHCRGLSRSRRRGVAIMTRRSRKTGRSTVIERVWMFAVILLCGPAVGYSAAYFLSWLRS